MATEFSGKYSPVNKPREMPEAVARTAKPRAMGRARLMFFAPLPLLLTGFGQIGAGSVGGIVRDFGAFAILILAAWLLREGLKAEAEYNMRSRARKPALPRKIIASDLCGVGVAVAAFNGSELVLPVVLGALAMVLHLVAFGLDPLKNKGMDGLENLASRRAALAIEEAEAHVADIIKAGSRLKDPVLSKRLNAFTASARAMFRTIEDDPRDLTTARKYLSVYLVGARDATIKFADLYAKTHDPSARADYEALLADLETNFNAERKEMLLDDRSDLDVEIDVLRDRLRLEGVQS